MIATEINKLTASIGLSASIVDGNRIRLQDASGELYMEEFVVSNVSAGGAEVKVIKDTSSSNVVDTITEHRLKHFPITNKISEGIYSFSDIRTEVGAESRKAQENEVAAQDILMNLEDEISEIRDADLAGIHTKLEFLMTNKEAAQATFTRITSKSLFDFLVDI